MNQAINEDLAKEVYETYYSAVCTYEVFLRRLQKGFSLLKENQVNTDQKIKPFFEREQLEEIKMALQYNQARLIQLLKENNQ